MTKVTDPRWRKSSRSGQEANCVEVHGDLGAVRDSKNATGPALAVDAAALVAAVKTGRLAS